MTITFHCDGCAVVGAQGTITGGFPGGWTVAYEYPGGVAGAGVCTETLHYCAECKSNGRYARRERHTPAEPVVKEPTVRRRRARVAPGKRRAAPRPDDEGQADLF